MITVRILTSGVLFTAGALLLTQIGSDAKPEKQPYQEHEEPVIARQKSVEVAPQALPSPSLTPDTSIVDPDRAGSERVGCGNHSGALLTQIPNEHGRAATDLFHHLAIR